jgi:hypothetical protein
VQNSTSTISCALNYGYSVAFLSAKFFSALWRVRIICEPTVFAGTASGSTVLNLFDSPEEAVGFALTISLFLGETWLLPLPGCNFF